MDPVSGQASAHGFRALRVGNASQAPDAAMSALARWLENKSTVDFNLGGWLTSHPWQGTDSLIWSLRAVGAGAIRVELNRTGGTEEIGDMLAALERGDTTGKPALRVGLRAPCAYAAEQSFGGCGWECRSAPRACVAERKPRVRPGRVAARPARAQLNGTAEMS